MHDAECDRLNLMCQTYNVSININFLLYSIRLNQIGLFVKLLAIILDSITSGLSAAFSALTPLAGHQEEHPACRNWVMRCWCGYLSGARYRLLACGSATAPENPWSFASFKPKTGFTFLLLAYSVVLEKRLLNGCCSSNFLLLNICNFCKGDVSWRYSWNPPYSRDIVYFYLLAHQICITYSASWILRLCFDQSEHIMTK